MGSLFQPGASIDAPAGIHFVPATLEVGAGDRPLFVTMFKDTTGTPDRCVIVATLSTSTVALVEYKRLDNTWVFDPADCALDTSITLMFTAAAQTDLHAFAIDSPAGTSDRVVFISTNDASQTPDTFELNSVVLTPGSSSLTAVTSVVAGTNQPTDTNGMVVVSTASSTTRLMTLFQDDFHFADITESSGTYTFTYDDAKVLAVDTDMNGGQEYSIVVIGSQVVLGNFGQTLSGASILWEITASAVLTEEFKPFAVGAMGAHQATAIGHRNAITAIGGRFAVASAYSGGDADADDPAYIITTFPLDDI